ncbi:MAG TPA: glycosyltransferase family 2 protein [Candidatus Woesearchaeota archaeon]|nr:glycosyltransferase family 2 protein [Candidatus Woesearchaeota archaeon]
MVDFGEILISVIAFVSLYTAIFFIITLLEHRNNLVKKARLRKYPSVCIIVPCYNEEKTLAKTLDSLLALDYPKKKLDIIVVDDGSTDNTYAVARKYVPKGVRVFKKKNGGKYTALNLGLSKTKAEFVGALDADSFVHPQALKRMLPYFDNPRVMAVTPSLKVYKPKSLLQRIQMVEYAVGIFFRKMFALVGSIHVTPGPFSIYRKAFFDKHGPYRKAYMTEDIEIALRMQHHNYIIENAVDAYVYTISPKSFKSLYYQRRRWYNGFLRNILDYKKLFSKKHGNLGVYVLPLAFISIGLVIISFSYTIYKTIDGLWNNYLYAKAINFDIFRFDFSPDLFMININTAFILGVITIITGIVMIVIAMKLAKEKQKILLSYILYVVSYWVLFSFWWLVVFFYKVTGKKVSWNPGKDSCGSAPTKSLSHS